MWRLQNIALESVTDGRTDRRTDRRRTKWSLCVAKVWHMDGQTDGRTEDRQSDPYVSLCFAGNTKSRKNQCQFFCQVTSCIDWKIFATVFLSFTAGKCHGSVNNMKWTGTIWVNTIRLFLQSHLCSHSVQCGRDGTLVLVGRTSDSHCYRRGRGWRRLMSGDRQVHHNYIRSVSASTLWCGRTYL